MEKLFLFVGLFAHSQSSLFKQMLLPGDYWTQKVTNTKSAQTTIECAAFCQALTVKISCKIISY